MTNEELQKEMIAAMKAKDKVRLSIIRQVKTEVKNIEVNERREITEEDVNNMIKRLIKQTSETLEMSIKAGNRWARSWVPSAMPRAATSTSRRLPRLWAPSSPSVRKCAGPVIGDVYR